MKSLFIGVFIGILASTSVFASERITDPDGEWIGNCWVLGRRIEPQEFGMDYGIDVYRETLSLGPVNVQNQEVAVIFDQDKQVVKTFRGRKYSVVEGDLTPPERIPEQLARNYLEKICL